MPRQYAQAVDPPTTTERGYGADHQALRRWWAPRVATGRIRCWRCGQLIPARAEWHLGHDDHDRRITRGPEHALCNLRAAAAKGNRSPLRARLRRGRRPRPPRTTTLRW